MLNRFKQNIIDIFGHPGKEWLAKLPTVTAEFTEKFQLIDLQPVTNLSFNYVASGFQNKKPIILKLGPNDKALSKETKCLNAFAQHGGVEVIASEPGMMLMQRATPGTALKTYFPNQDDQAITILCQCISHLHQAEIPKQHDFYHLNTLLAILDNDLDIPAHIVSKARQLRDNLLSSTEKTVLLHGDLHHENILQHDNRWLVIDPKGFIGDPVFEVCAFMHNPEPELLNQDNPIEIIDDRTRFCADLLGYSTTRVYDWLYVKSVLCWAWRLDDNLSADYFKRFVSLLDKRDSSDEK